MMMTLRILYVNGKKDEYWMDEEEAVSVYHQLVNMLDEKIWCDIGKFLHIQSRHVVSVNLIPDD